MLIFGRQSSSSVLLLSGVFLSLGLSGCGGNSVQEAIGFEQAGPDEMAVIKRPPLIVPPDYNLRPPKPGQSEDGGNAASEAARNTLVGPSGSVNGAPGGEGATPESSTDARAILTGTPSAGGEDVSTDNVSDGEAASKASEGQALLVDRANRVEQDLDEVGETRGENRVDGDFLEEILAWDPDQQAAPSVETAANDATSVNTRVEVLRREQTPIPTEAGQ